MTQETQAISIQEMVDDLYKYDFMKYPTTAFAKKWGVHYVTVQRYLDMLGIPRKRVQKCIKKPRDRLGRYICPTFSIPERSSITEANNSKPEKKRKAWQPRTFFEAMQEN